MYINDQTLKKKVRLILLNVNDGFLNQNQNHEEEKEI